MPRLELVGDPALDSLELDQLLISTES